jgi:hypothetical protein
MNMCSVCVCVRACVCTSCSDPLYSRPIYYIGISRIAYRCVMFALAAECQHCGVMCLKLQTKPRDGPCCSFHLSAPSAKKLALPVMSTAVFYFLILRFLNIRTYHRHTDRSTRRTSKLFVCVCSYVGLRGLMKNDTLCALFLQVIILINKCT